MRFREFNTFRHVLVPRIQPMLIKSAALPFQLSQLLSTCRPALNAGLYPRDSPRLVWFYLYGNDNKPYKGAGADAVFLSQGSLLLLFRDKLKEKAPNEQAAIDS